jgi:anti-sigma regulatory factor (Ser/Thr protein kinase)
VTVTRFDDRVEIVVEDFGHAFDPAQYTLPHLPDVPGDDAAIPEGGLGLHLVGQLVDRLSIDLDRAKGNGWTLVKYLPI